MDLYQNGYLSRFDENIYEKLKKISGDEDDALNEGLEEVEEEALEEEALEEEDEEKESILKKSIIAILILFS